MGGYKPAVGDRVRVVIEGEVADDLGYAFTVEAAASGARSTITRNGEGHIVSVEKIEPPVTVFKPGSVVRRKANGSLWALGQTHYLALEAAHGRSYPYGGNNFTSDYYELVPLG